MEAGANRRLGGADALGDLGVPVPLATKFGHLTIARKPELGDGDSGEEVVLLGGGGLGGGFESGRFRRAPLPAKRGQCGVANDLIQPGGELALGLKRLDATGEIESQVIDHIVRELVIFQHLPCERQGSVSVLTEESPRGFGVATSSGLNEVRIAAQATQGALTFVRRANSSGRRESA